MAKLNRDQIVAAPLRHETVKVPEWGGEVEVWELSAGDRLKFEAGFNELESDAKLAALARACIGGDDGPFNPPIELEDLRKKSASAVLRIYHVALRLNVMSKEAADKLLGE